MACLLWRMDWGIKIFDSFDELLRTLYYLPLCELNAMFTFSVESLTVPVAGFDGTLVLNN